MCSIRSCGVFDEGRLTDQYGRVTNFRSTIIIMTSNLKARVRAGGRLRWRKRRAAISGCRDEVLPARVL